MKILPQLVPGIMHQGSYVICGNIVHSTEEDPLVYMPDKCIGVKENKIIFLDEKSRLQERLSEHNLTTSDVTFLAEKQFLIPGFVDTHLHAPQFPNCGKGLDRGLLEWLETYTFPTEAKFKDLQYALDNYKKVVWRILRNGTTTGCYYATIDTDATLVLCDVIARFGQRAYVGKVNMNQNSPEYYCEASTEESLAETKRYIESLKLKNYPTVSPIITPRFAISCTEDLMKGLAGLAKDYNLPIQTHICETRDEIKAVSEMFPAYSSYTDVYDKMGLLNEKTVLAHGIYLTQDQIDTIKTRECSISHCPNSNISIRSGVLDVQKLLKQNVKVSLGTDISGGYHPSMLDAIRTAVMSSNMKAIESHNNGYRAITVREAFRLATLGGAKALGLESKIGNFEVGKDFDALIIDPCTLDSVLDIHDDDKLMCCMDKFLFTGDDRNIVSIFVAGKKVFSKQLQQL